MKCTRYNRCKRRRDGVLRRCAAMRAGKERKRLARAIGCGEWRVVRTLLVWTPGACVAHVWRVSCAPDGKALGLEIDGVWRRYGTERSLRAALAKVMWGTRDE